MIRIVESGEEARTGMVDFISKFIAEKGYSPSVRDIMKGCGYKSTSTVQHHLEYLAARKRISYAPHVARSIRVLG